MREIDYRRKVEQAFIKAFSDFKRAHARGDIFDFDACGASACVRVDCCHGEMRLTLNDPQFNGLYGCKATTQPRKTGRIELSFTPEEFDLMLPYFVEVTRAVLLQDASLLPAPPTAMSHVGYRVPVTTPSYWATRIHDHIYEHTEAAWEDNIARP
jgi:hypothetical protein